MNVAVMEHLGPWAWTGGWSPDRSEIAMLRLPLGDPRNEAARGGPRRWAYVALGMVLALGAPVGFVLLQALQARRASLWWLQAELANDLHVYLYILLSTMVVFALFGYVLGRQAELLVALANTDPLTGLHNARLLRARLEDEFARAQRYGVPLSLLLIDLDGLKQINDRRGHRAGDAALQAVAAALRGGSRAADIVARWGGDEFALLAPHTEEAAAALLGDRIRAAVGRDTAGAEEEVTISAGVATLGEEARFASPDALIAAADAALYEAKRSGKDSVVAWSERTNQNTHNEHNDQGRGGRPARKGGH